MNRLLRGFGSSVVMELVTLPRVIMSPTFYLSPPLSRLKSELRMEIVNGDPRGYRHRNLN